MPRLTKRVVDAAPVKGASYFLWCSELSGFGVRLWPTGRAAFYADYRNADGTRRRMMIGEHGKVTCEEARKLALGILGSAVKGADPAEERASNRKALTVRELCEKYLSAAERGLLMGKRGLPKKASTVYVDRGRIARHILPLLGNRRVRDLAQSDINKFIRDVADGKTALVEKTGNKRGKAVVEGGLGTAARTAGLLGGILSFAVSEGVIESNPARGVRRPAGQRRKRRLSGEEYRALGRALAEADAHHEPWQLIAITRLLALSGARSGEIINLRWSEFDHAAHCLRLHDSKEGASTRPLGKPARDLLAGLERSGEHVFPASRRGEGAFGGMAGGWIRLMKRAGLEGVTLHTLRHSFGSVADDLGLSLATTGALLGHSSGSVTARYVHKTDPVLIAAADNAAGHIFEEMNAGGADGEEQRRLLQAYAAEPWHEKGATAARDGRRPEADDRLLWEMARLLARQPALSQREAAKVVVDASADRTHSLDAAADRLRRKYREHAELLQSVLAAVWDKTQPAR
ncbi:tyrosine-type recombinase/integrase [Bosea sp. 2RAB26]|uniref:tyrosine-type recombinase/integrase n=1 Tax=Bosea sp. 2RAB26 TaxID=3237476 RepID=UPI003F8FD407